MFDHCAEAVAAESTLLLDVGSDVAYAHFGEQFVEQGTIGVPLANTDEECQFASLWAAIHCSPRRAMNPM